MASLTQMKRELVIERIRAGLESARRQYQFQLMRQRVMPGLTHTVGQLIVEVAPFYR
jgi:hypothetical protein